MIKKLKKYVMNFKFRCFEGISSSNIVITLSINLLAVLLIPIIKLSEQQRLDFIEVLIQLLIVLVTFISSYLIIKDEFKRNEAIKHFISIFLLVVIAQYYIRSMYEIAVIICSVIFTLVLLWGIFNSYKIRKKIEIEESKEAFQNAKDLRNAGGVKL